MTTPDYAGLVDPEVPSSGELAYISAMGQELLRRRARVAEVEEELKAAKAAASELGDVVLPRLMAAVGLSRFDLPDGTSLSVGIKQTCSIAGERRGPAIEWLDENGHGGLVKTAVSVYVPRTNREVAQELVRELAARGVGDVSEEAWVESGTLLAHLKELKKAGVPFPEETFGWHERATTDVKVPKV